MDDFADPEKLKALASLLAPGLIILTVRSSVSGGPKPDFKDRIVHYAAISSIYYAVAYPLFNWKGGLEIDVGLWRILQYCLVPLFVGIVLAYEVQGQWLSRVGSRVGLLVAHPTAAAWDFAFEKIRSGTFILVTLTDGSQVAGLLGALSFASSSREERDLLLERVWTIDQSGNWTEAQPARSILLCGKDIRYVEIF
uniref:DUF6338 family protein n=1 Tax=uncultured Caulobacter sp. TaxID=158749 RepID=UPI0025EFD019|nr:DUF6338 family protein [uncultured Caulobacter sp.]